MAIRKMNVDMFDKIANNKAIKEETFELTAEQAELLYQEGIEELKQNAMILNMCISSIGNSSFGFALLETQEFLEFKQAMKYYMEFVIPSLLEGDIDSIIENAPKDTEGENEIFKEDLEFLGNLFYQELAEKYL